MAKKKREHVVAETGDKKTISEAFDVAVRSVRRNSNNPNAAKIYDLAGNILKRRKAAAYNLLPEIRKRYGQLYSDDGIAMAWAKECSALGHSIDGTDHLYFITLAASIWMLDELKHTGKLGNALPYFSRDWDKIAGIAIPEIFDPCHDETLIRGMMYLIRERDPRDNDFQFYINDASAKRTEPVLHQLPGTDTDELSPRKRFNAVMSLIHPVVKERAVNRFLSKFWEFLDLYFECDAPLYKAYQACRAESDALMDDCRVLHKKIMTNEVPEVKVQPSSLLTKRALPLPGMELPTVGNGFEPTRSESLRIDDMSRLQLMADKGLALENKADEIETQRVQIMMTAHMAQMIPYEEAVESMGEEVAEKFIHFEIDDPYEICFAYLCLIEEGSNIPWAYNGALAVLMAALRKLPWNAYALELEEELEGDDEDEDESDWDEEEEPSDGVDEDEDESAPLDWNEKKAELYRLDYQSSPLYAPFDNPNPDWKLNITQIMFGLTGLVMPRTVSDNEGMAEEFAKAGIDKGLAEGLELYLQLALDIQLHDSKMRDRLHHVLHRQFEELQKAADEESADKENVAALRARLKELKESNDSYREKAHQAESEIDLLRQEMERIENRAAEERTELADLRELVFTQANATGNEDTEQDNPPAGRFPYTVKKRVVVFGGHDTWLKAIKPLLPNVAFVNREQRPNADMIRAADVIWIQPNALSHRSFYKIINVVRTNQVPLRYFGYASAMKCALQVVEDDEESET